MRKIIVVLFLCLLTQGFASASTFKLDPQVLDGQKSIKRQGVEDVVSHKKASVLIRPSGNTYTSEDRPTFVVGVYGEKEVIFSTDNINIFIDGKPHRVISPKEQAAEIKNNYDLRVSAAQEAYKAESDKVVEENVEKDIQDVQMVIGPPEALSRRQSIPGQTKSNPNVVFDSVGMSEGQKQAKAKLDLDLDVIKKDTNEAIKRLKTTALLKAKVPPKNWFLGEVTMDQLPDPDSVRTIKVVVDISGENHEFILKNIKVQ